ncbi:MAG: alpha/beta fold hydrolase [Promethearchaeia archaeon]
MFSLLILCIIIQVGDIYPPNSRVYKKEKINIEASNSNPSDFDVLNFWENEMQRVNETDLNIEYKENNTLDYENPYSGKKYEFIKQEIAFNSPNWVGQSQETLQLQGYLIYPENTKNSNSSNPGCLCMHGLNGNVNESFRLAFQYLEKGFIVLAYDHPGHGNSEGAKPSPKNFYFEGDFNKTSHNYLTICGAIQGLRVLENQSLINKSQIMVTGRSYGGLNTMWLSGISGERIAGAVPFIAVGDIKQVLKFPNKMFFWIWSKSPEDIPNSFWENQNLRFDPIYYLHSAKTPPMFWQFGTTDEFFPYTSVNGTLDAVPHKNKFIQLYPNGHHGLEGYQNTTKYFIDYIIKDGPSPPNITLESDNEKGSTIIGDSLGTKINVETENEIASVKVVYKYLDIVGARWESAELTSTEDDSWERDLSASLLNSRINFYFIVTFKGKDNVWFSSKIYTGGMFHSNIHFIFLLSIIGIISLVVIYFLYRRYKNDVLNQPEDIQTEAKKNLILESVLVGMMEILFLISPFLVWTVIDDGIVTWTHLYLFNNIYSVDTLFGILTPFITEAFLISWISLAILSIMKPILSGVLRIWYPLTALIVIGFFTNMIFSSGTTGGDFGRGYAGIGVYVMLLSNIGTIIIGIWKRKYQTDLGIRKSKTNWYNLDHWLRIKTQKGEENLEDSTTHA